MHFRSQIIVFFPDASAYSDRPSAINKPEWMSPGPLKAFPSRVKCAGPGLFTTLDPVVLFINFTNDIFETISYR